MRRVLVLSIALSLATAACTSSGTTATAPHTTATATSALPVSSSVTTPAAPTLTASPKVTHAAPIPPVSAQARADGLLDVRTIVPDAVIDLRYATTNNFTHVRLYPRDARCLVHRSMADGLRTAAARLRALGDVLVFWDCYRPHSVQVRMFQVVPDSNWVARPGKYATSHESGRSVDVTIARRPVHTACSTGTRIQGHCALDMGTGFDDFTPRAHAYATQDVSDTAQADRATLRNAMAAGGLTVYSGEWWHFDGPGALVPRPILAAPVD